MRVLYNFLLLIFVLQLLQMSSLKASATSATSPDTLTPKKQLMRFYRREFNLLAGEICSKLKVINEKILNDDIFQSSAKPLLLEFQQNLTHFQNLYPYYVRFGLNEPLAIAFANMMHDFYAVQPFYLKDTVAIKQLLKQSAYDNLRQEYKSKLQNFFLNTYANKFEQLKRQTTDKVQLEKFQQRFAKCIEEAKKCEDYECLLTNFRNNAFTSEAKLIGNIQRHLLDLSIILLYDMKHFYKNLVTHPKFPRLEPAIKRELLTAFQRSDANFQEIDNFQYMYHLGATDLLQSTLMQHGSELKAKQQQLIIEIFEDSGHKNPSVNFNKGLAEFIAKDFVLEVENFRASFEQEESAAEEPLMQMLQGLGPTSSLSEKQIALARLNVIEKSKLKKWRL